MRVLLIVNPFATSTTDVGRDALVRTLSAHVDLTTELTTHRGHAGEIAAQAHTQGYNVIVIHGGDGTINEAVNGMLGTPLAHITTSEPRPAIAVIPGGSANVFARSLGIDPDPHRATTQLITLMQDRSTRRISLGHADNRWFLFNAGLGVDANVIRSMEVQRSAGKKVSEFRYLVTTVRTFITASRKPPRMTVRYVERSGVDHSVNGATFAFINNANPWTYIGNLPIWTNRATNYSTGLGLFTSQSMSILRNTPLFLQLLTGRAPSVPHLTACDDVTSVEIQSTEPIDLQIDGDYIGARTNLTCGVAAGQLDVIAPQSKR